MDKKYAIFPKERLCWENIFFLFFAVLPLLAFAQQGQQPHAADVSDELQNQEFIADTALNGSPDNMEITVNIATGSLELFTVTAGVVQITGTGVNETHELPA